MPEAPEGAKGVRESPFPAVRCHRELPDAPMTQSDRSPAPLRPRSTATVNQHVREHGDASSGFDSPGILQEKRKRCSSPPDGAGIHSLPPEVPMAHAPDRLSDGTGAMFSLPDTPWHGEGTVLDSPLARGGASLGGPRLRGGGSAPLYRARPFPGPPEVSEYRQVENGCATVRSDRQEVLGGVHSDGRD